VRGETGSEGGDDGGGVGGADGVVEMFAVVVLSSAFIIILSSLRRLCRHLCSWCFRSLMEVIVACVVMVSAIQQRY
jgi:hypothetical protein